MRIEKDAAREALGLKQIKRQDSDEIVVRSPISNADLMKSPGGTERKPFLTSQIFETKKDEYFVFKK